MEINQIEAYIVSWPCDCPQQLSGGLLSLEGSRLFEVHANLCTKVESRYTILSTISLQLRTVARGQPLSSREQLCVYRVSSSSDRERVEAYLYLVSTQFEALSPIVDHALIFEEANSGTQ